MLDPFGSDQHSYFIPLADFFAGICSIFLVVAVLLFFQITDPKQNTKEGDIRSPGNVMVETFWKENVDVDLWVKSPDDPHAVGYSRKQGKSFDLLRDDLGFTFESQSGQHHENVFSRNAPSGEYVVNLHMYSNRNKSAYPIVVDVYVQIVKNTHEEGANGSKADVKKVMHTKIDLVQEGQEITVVRFRLDGEGNLIPDSVNYEPIKLREAR